MSYTKANDLRKAEKLVQQGKIKPAIKEYENLVMSNPGDTNLLNILGDLYVRDGRTDDAIVTFVKLAEATLRDGHTPRAIAVYKKIYKLAPGNTDVALKLAELYIRQNLMVEARKQYLEIADYYTKNGRSRQALELLQRVADLDPENVPARLRLAENYQREGMKEQAIEAYIAAGAQLIRKSSLAEAQQVFQRVLELNPASTPALNSLATIYIKQGEPQRAVALLSNVAQQRPDDTDILILSGRIYLQADLLNEAETALLKLLEVDKTRFEYVLTLAQKFIDQGLYDRGTDLIEKCIEPMITRRQETRGVELLQKVIEANPYHLKAHQCLVTIYRRLGEGNELPGALKQLAVVALHHEERGIAEKALRELVELEPNEPAHLEMMRAYGFTSPVSPTIAERDRVVPGPVYTGGVGQRVEFTPEILAGQPPFSPPPDSGVGFGYTSGSGFAPLSPSAPETAVFGTPSFAPAGGDSVASGFGAPAPFGFETGIGGFNNLQTGGFTDFTSPSSVSYPPPSLGSEALPPEVARLKADAERFANLGMPDKAIELLQEAVNHVPGSIELRLLLKQICTDVGRDDEAGRQAAALATLYAQRGDHAQSQRFQAEARQLAASHQGGGFELAGSVSTPSMPSVPPAQVSDEVEIDISGSVQTPTPTPSSPAVGAFDFGYTSGEGFTLHTEAIYVGPPHFPTTPPESVPTFDAQQPVFEISPAPSSDTLQAVAEAKLQEQLEGIKFYIEQGFFDVARDNLARLSLEFPNHPEVLALLAKVQSPPSAPEPDLTSLALPTDAAAEVPVSKPESIGSLMNGLVSELEKALEELEMGNFDAPAVTNLAAKPEPAPASSGSILLGESGLQDVFDEFKQSVEADAEATPDFETHYNLGLAYKDMDLFDEAIEEFQTAFRGTDPHSSDPHYFQVCNMLGLCFMAKNEPQLATVWFKRGVEAPGRTEDEYQAMRYDLGMAYEQMGRYDLALEVFETVYAVDVNYREVAEKVAELRQRVKRQ
ncbi:MAG: tetratricopeptide repeat protein [Chloracidobacterium sp.]|nr:tetratricopeptide repeat protein [Chloracidobacterium sp.]MDW8216614.1 tetratricopeptide repeat protein [Acidobacteriota bacterium]